MTFLKAVWGHGLSADVHLAHHFLFSSQFLDSRFKYAYYSTLGEKIATWFLRFHEGCADIVHRECLACQRVKIHQHVRAPLEKVLVPDSANLPPSTLIWLALYLRLRASPTCWWSSIGFRDGEEAIPNILDISSTIGRQGFPQSVGFPFWRAERRSFLTEGFSSSPNCGQTLHRSVDNVLAPDNGLSSAGKWLGGPRFHRQLKASLSACLSGQNWVGQLSMGHVRNQGHTQGWLGSLPGGDGLRDSTECYQASSAVWQERHRPWSLSSTICGGPWKISTSVPTSIAHCKAAACSMYWRYCRTALWFGSGKLGRYCQPLTPRYEAQFRIVERHPKFFKIQLGGKQDNISIDCLKPATVPEGTGPARPRMRGRPAKALVAPAYGGWPSSAGAISATANTTKGFTRSSTQGINPAGLFGCSQHWGPCRATIQASDSVQRWGKTFWLFHFHTLKYIQSIKRVHTGRTL